MALATFYYQALEISDTDVVLSTTESDHAIKSRRLRQGSEIQLINGKGLIAQATIEESTKREVKVHIKSIDASPSPDTLVIATAIPKGDRQRTMIDMLTQLGVTEIIPLRCEHSVAQFKPSTFAKWQRLAIEACKQSQNPWLPIISTEHSVQEVIKNANMPLFYADKLGQTFLSLNGNTNSSLTVLVGPEGGFSEQELEMLKTSCTPINLGANILRTELASVAAIAQARIIMKYN